MLTAAEPVLLDFGARGPSVIPDLSAVARYGDTLFVASDETAEIDVLQRAADGWAFDQTIALGDLLSLPGGKDDEADIEALAIDGDWLWVAGSHALVRQDVRGQSGRKGLRGLGEIKRQSNRFLLARIPICVGRGGHATLVAERSGKEAQMLEAGKRSSALLKWLEDDPLLSPFTELPSKENGIDIEGISARDGIVCLGLRGPVIRGYAIILQLDVTGGRRQSLKARKREGGRRYRKYLLWLDGLGIRDLARVGEDLIVLAGATTMAEVPPRIYRWKGALNAGESSIVDPADIAPIADLPWNRGGEKAEAIAPLSDNALLVLHDSPSDWRIGRGKRSVLADRLVPVKT